MYNFKHSQPPKLQCGIKCVGEQRAKGKNVKEATKYCNKICKRDVEDGDEQEEQLDERAMSRYRVCLYCTNTMMNKGYNSQAAKNACNCAKVSVRDAEDDSDEELDERRIARIHRKRPNGG